MTLLFNLGAPNDDQGNLSQIALDRANCTLNIFNSDQSVKIICTGGIGEHFNRTNLPHAMHVQKYLVSEGVPRESLIDVIESKNTFEDLTLAKPLIEKYKPLSVIMVTSDFHMQRVKLICSKIGWYNNCDFISAVSTVSTEELEILNAHEEKAIAILNRSAAY